MPTVDVDSAPTVGIFINDQWRAVLLSLVAAADNPVVWANEDDLDRIEQNAYKLYEAIRNPIIPEGRMHHIGEPFAMFTSTAPDGALAMNGIPRMQADYPELMEKIPASWKAGNYFTLPNMATRGLFGAFSLIEFNAPVGSTFGEVFHTLTVDEIPSHRHVENFRRTLSGQPAMQAVGAGSGDDPSSNSTGYTGGDQPHNNMPPGLACYWFIQAE